MRKMNARVFATMLKLADGTRSCAQLSEETGLCKLTVYHYMKALHQAKLVHIGGWELDSSGRCTLRLYQFGPGIDRKPQIQDRAKRNRQYRERAKQQAMLHAISGKLAA